ncbi:MAG: Gfo/Idh/MocA family oxidoreductase [Candidatus Hydrogenedentes bacterium]|nr:Gfo/Idh/MocA family oxidoreductase [Candidatus Hydrogenedentota bacterium]
MARKTVSRRRFLTTTFAAAAAPMVVPSSVLGRAGAVPPSERITMGFIGLGTQGSGHLFGGAWTYVTGGYLGRDDVQVLGVCDVWRGKREGARDRVNAYYADKAGAGKFTSCEAYRDFRELITRDDVDAVLMALPFHWHANMATLAAKAGKDVYSEKPIALTIREGRTLVETVQRYGRIYQAGTQQRSEYGGKFRRACELVRNGRIGTLKEVYAYRPGGGFQANLQNGLNEGVPVPDDLDWNLFVGPGPWQAYTGHNASLRLFSFGDPNWGPHHYDTVQWGIGADRTGPVEVGMQEGHSVLRYENGVVVHACGYPGERVGGDGGACFVGTEGRIVVDRENLLSDPPGILGQPLTPDDERLYDSNCHADNFLACIRSRKQTICDVETAHRAMSLVLLGGIAMQLNRTMTWDPVKEEFPGDDEANRLLSYAKRPGWQL